MKKNKEFIIFVHSKECISIIKNCHINKYK